MSITESREPPAQQAPSLRDRILAEFAPEVAPVLVEFADLIATLEADFLIFMARKALRLHDLLVLAGCATNERTILSSHVLEQDLSRFSGKHVALIDDTLILGSTLGLATRRLRAVGAEVSTYVFAVDKANWVPELAVPDRMMMVLEHEAMLTLCANEVEALALAGVPYLADFSLTRPIKFTKRRVGLFQALQTWTPYPLTSSQQVDFGTLTFSVLPTPETRERLAAALGPFAAITEIAKVRAYGRTKDGELWFRFVPVLTLKPLAVDQVPVLWRAVLDGLPNLTAKHLEQLDQQLSNSKARLRFLQYCASVRLGRAFSDDLQQGLGLRRGLLFEENEAVRLFGPWLRPVLTRVHDHPSGGSAPSELRVSVVPLQVEVIARTELLAVVRQQADDVPPDVRARNVFTDVSRAFTRLYRDHELPARDEARHLGPEIFDADASLAPHRDRLEYGFAWDTLVSCMLENEGVRQTPDRAMRLSLLLDVLIDIGVAVPVLCERDGVLFRAYRHGEDVTFLDQEAALSYDVIAGYLEASGREVVPRLICEKLLVSLFRVGVAKGFLKVVHGMGGGQRVARVGFHLHGAVAFRPMEDTIFADDQDSWLSTYLADTGVIGPGRGGYVIGTRPEAALTVSAAQAEAHQLGYLVGRLMSERKPDGRPVLDADDLVLLTTCPLPRETAGAVVAELRIIQRWFSGFQRMLDEPRGGVRQIRGREHIDWTSLDSIRTAQKRVTGASGYLALHSARLKTCGFLADRPRVIYERCAKHLEALPSGSFLAAHWRGCWSSIVDPGNLDQHARFGTLLEQTTLEIFWLAVGVFSIELGLLSAEAALQPDGDMAARYRQACRKALGFLEELRSHVSPPPKIQEAYERLVQVARSEAYMPAPSKACIFGATLIERRRHMLATLIHRTANAIVEYGVGEARATYALSLWYDIIDSTGEKSGLKGDSLRAYRQRVRSFKTRADEDLGALIRAASEQNGNVYCWNAPLNSADDEKNIFFDGRHALTYMSDASDLLLRAARDCGVRIRILMINGDFAGDPPHKFLSSPTVEGEGYWESISRVKAALKQLEPGLATAPGRAFVWGAQDVIPFVADAFPHLKWLGEPHQVTVPVEIENFPLEVRAWGGPVR